MIAEPKLRPYQQRTHEAIRRAIGEKHSKILVVMPTGAGKGFLAAKIMQDCTTKGNNSIFFADQRELVTQLVAQLDRLDAPHDVMLAGFRKEFHSSADFANALAMVASKDTLWSRAFRKQRVEIPPARVVQFDEAHRSLAETWQGIAQAYAESIVVGWTATPCRMDGCGLGDFYTKMIIGATYAELQAAGSLVPVRICSPDRVDLKGLKMSKGDYAKKQLEERMNVDKLVGDIIRDWKLFSLGRQTVCYASGIQHSIHIRNSFRQAGISAEHIDGGTETSERDDIMGRVSDGKVTVLCNYGVATTGVDVPEWKYMINARPTKSFSLWRQMGGRIQRPLDGHDHCRIQDHTNCAETFGFPDEDVNWTLDTSVKIQEKHEREQKEKKKADPYTCERCSETYRGPACPSCGHKPERRGKEVEMSKGELKELERAKANRAATQMDKQKEWDDCLGWAIGKDKKVGAAAHRYKDKFGVFPNDKLENVPRSSQWQMEAKDFYDDVIKPEKEALKEQFKRDAAEQEQSELPW